VLGEIDFLLRIFCW